MWIWFVLIFIAKNGLGFGFSKVIRRFNSNRDGEVDPPSNEIYEWLKKYKLDKYGPLFEEMRFTNLNQIRALTPQAFQSGLQKQDVLLSDLGQFGIAHQELQLKSPQEGMYSLIYLSIF